MTTSEQRLLQWWVKGLQGWLNNVKDLTKNEFPITEDDLNLLRLKYTELGHVIKDLEKARGRNQS